MFLIKKLVDMQLLHQIENVFLLRYKNFVDTIVDMSKIVSNFLE